MTTSAQRWSCKGEIMFADLSIPLSSKTGDDMQEMYDNKNAQMYIAGLV